MINDVVLVGRLTRDAELRHTGSGKAVASFILAVNRPFKNKNGEQEADFVNIVVWGKTAEAVDKYTRKGSLIGIVGRIQTRNYTNNDGKKVYVTEVVAENVQFLDPKKEKQEEKDSNPTSQYNQQSDPFESNGSPVEINDDDLPF